MPSFFLLLKNQVPSVSFYLTHFKFSLQVQVLSLSLQVQVQVLSLSLQVQALSLSISLSLLIVAEDRKRVNKIYWQKAMFFLLATRFVHVFFLKNDVSPQKKNSLSVSHFFNELSLSLSLSLQVLPLSLQVIVLSLSLSPSLSHFLSHSRSLPLFFDGGNK